MPSPFPGMNPYFEHPVMWADFHNSFIHAIREQLNQQIRPAYFAKVEELLFIHELTSEERRFMGRTDVGIVDRGAFERKPGSKAMQAPFYGTVSTAVDIETHAFLEIRDRENQSLITVIEVLSPANKNSGPDRNLYLAKRRQILAGGAHLVELDLLRAGPRLPLDGMPDCDYCAVVSRSEERPRAGIWPNFLRDAFLPIPIPLRAPDADAIFDIKVGIDHVYDSAGYEDYVYLRPPQPPLPEGDIAWAKQFIP
jgi:uncharacterized protein DUF4058